MKRVLNWILEEKITLMVLLLAIGIILSSLSNLVFFGAMVIYAVIFIALLTAGHKLFLKFKKK